MVSVKSVLIFVAGVTILHILTYYLAGMIALVAMGEGQYDPPSPNAIIFLRDPKLFRYQNGHLEALQTFFLLTLMISFTLFLSNLSVKASEPCLIA